MHSNDLEIRLLGPLEVRSGPVRAELPPSRKARALLAYLVATGRAHSRSSLCDLFWEEVDDPRAGLRWALSKLRGVVDGEDGPCIVTTRDLVEFDGGPARVDLHEVDRCVGSDPRNAEVEALSDAATEFRGPFLEGLDLPACHRWEAWSLGLRERLRSRHVAILATLVRKLEGEPERAVGHALDRLSIDPYSEAAYRGAIRCLHRVGRVEQALELHDRCCRMLAEHLGAEPSDDLVSLRRGIERGMAPPTVEERPTPEDRPAPLGLPPIGPREPRLVGRAAEMARLREMVDSAGETDAPSAILLSGEPGIGKTRLLRELVGEVGDRGGWAVSGAVFDTEEIRPYGPWIDLLRQIPRSRLGSSAEALGGLVSGPDDRTPSGGPESVPASGPEERSQLFDATAAVLRRLGRDRGPGVVILDDIQWLDAASSALLHYLVRTLDDTPIVFALAVRNREVRGGSAVARTLRSLDDAGRLQTVRLRRLDAAETGELVRAVDPRADPDSIFATSEGNPLFALAITDSWEAGGDRIPSTIQEELEDRLQRLDEDSRSLLPWAAALGRAFDVRTLVHVLDRPADEIITTLDTLDRRGILRAGGPDRYDFSHSLLRQAAYRRISRPARRAIHRSIAERLDRLDRSEGRLSGAVAHHAERGGLVALSARACVEAAEDSLWVFAFEEVAELVERGLAQVGELPDEVRIPIEMDLLRIYSFRSMQDRRPDDVEERVRRVTREALGHGLRNLVATGHALKMELEFQRGAFEAAERSSVRSAEAGRAGDPEVATRSLAETAACLLILDRSPRDARRLANEAAELAREHGLELAVVALAHALLHHLDGRLDEAAAGFREVIRLARHTRDRWWESQAMTRIVMVELDRGNAGAALALAAEAVATAERARDEPEAAFARGLEVIADMRAQGPDDPRFAALDTTLETLRTLDSVWHVAHLQAYGAESELECHRPDEARRRALEVREAGTLLERPSLLALSCGLLGHAAALEGDSDGRAELLDSPEVSEPEHPLSHRARQALEAARRTLGTDPPSPSTPDTSVGATSTPDR